MSNPRIMLPATGGGALLAGLFFNRFFLVITAILLGLLLRNIFRTIKGRAAHAQGPLDR